MRPSLVVSGLLRDGLGIGEAARSYARALDAHGFWVRQHVQRLSYRQDPVGDPGPGGLLPFEQALDDVEVDLVVTCLNPPELRDLRVHRAVHPAGRANVGVWAWELEHAPPEWADEAGRLDELWVSTEHIAGAVRPLVDCDVVVVPSPVTPPVGTGTRSALLDDRPTFLVLADGASTFARKNPVGAIAAFDRAFEPGEGPRLLVKVWNPEADPEGFADLREMASRRPDVDLVDQFLTREDFADLLGGVAGLVSLHRAEGMGLPIFEALALGRPVVMTNWSGPADLVDERHVLTVDFELAVAGEEAGPYAGSTWAEPDLDMAARQLRAVLDETDDVQRRVEAGRAFVLDELSVEAIGHRLAHRVDALLERTATRSPRQVLRPTIGVVSHAAEPWPAAAPFIRSITPQLADQGAELVLGVASPSVLPPEHRPRNVRVIEADTSSPFRLRAAALAGCDADLVVVTEDHCVPAPGWLLAFDAAFHTTDGELFAGAIGNGSMGSPADWANYLLGFVAYAPPLDHVPTGRCPTVANCAVDGAVLRDRLGVDPVPQALARDLIPALWRTGGTHLVPDAVVDHTQGFPGWRHVRNHYDDARMAGAWIRVTGGDRPSLWPGALREAARSELRNLHAEIQNHPELLDRYESAQHWLRLLAGARALGRAVGARFGPGQSGERLD